MTLTPGERLVLSQQYEILPKLYPERQDQYSIKKEIVDRGYTVLYSEISRIREEFPESVFKETMDILDMYKTLRSSYDRLEDKTGVDPDRLKFKGFDANDSDNHYLVAEFLIEKQGKWQEFSGLYLNSHSSLTIHHHRDLLSRYEEFRKKPELSKEDILAILG